MIERVAGDPRFKLELPASQLEIVTPPCSRRRAAVPRSRGPARPRRGRRADRAADDRRRPPDRRRARRLTDDPRYQRTLDEYGERARRQLVCGLHLHVSLGGADRTLAVYNALRSHLPELAALAANAPFHAGRDTGLASIRPASR